MTLNEDNELARFLLAVVMQKDLRDINWDQVASDPILLKPICTGHAARMRFARFRNLVTGHASTRRRPPAEHSARVSKAKKVPPPKKEKPVVKSEFTPHRTLCDLPSPSSASHDYRMLTPCSVNTTRPLDLQAASDEVSVPEMPMLPSPDGESLIDLANEHPDPPLVPNFDAAFEIIDLMDDVHDANPTTGWDSRFDDEFQF